MEFAEFLAPFDAGASLLPWQHFDEVLALTPYWNEETPNRVAIHLPLIVPGDCAIRVGTEMHAWRESERRAIEYAIAARGRWLQERRVPG